MRRILVFGATAALLAVVAVFAASRTERPAPSPSPGTATVATGSVALQEQRIRMDATHELWDKTARGLLESLKTRAYDARRDARLEYAEGTLALREGDIEAAYSFKYDVAHPVSDPVTFIVVSEGDGLSSGTSARARLWAVQSFVGASPLVAYYRPPVRLQMQPARDPASKNLIVLAPPHRGPLSVSYSFDERQVITARGEWTTADDAVVTTFDWELWHGLYLLTGERIHDGATIDYAYDDRHGPNLIHRVRLREGPRAVEAVLTYTGVRTRPE